MKITRIKLTNWGPHESLDQDLNDTVVGILGPNMSGKTNILKAIEFALTRNTDKDRNQTSYVRSGLDSKGEEITNGSVEIDIEKDGVTGTIFSQVGTSPRRWLKWEGETYKKVADIDSILKGILDCDRRALSIAVFMSQGKIGEFLFRTPTEREKAFAELCLVDHLPRVADIVEQKLLEVRKLITDHGPRLDELNTQISVAVGQNETATERLNSIRDRSAEIAWIRQTAGLRGALEEAEQRVKTDTERKDRAVVARNEVPKPYQECGKEDLDRALEGLEALAETEKQRADLASKIALVQAVEADLAQIEADQEAGRKAILRVTACDGELKAWEAVTVARKALVDLTARRDEALGRVKKGHEWVTAKNDTILKVEQDIAAQQDLLRGTSPDTINEAAMRLGILESLKDNIDVSCPVCRSRVNADELLGELDDLKVKVPAWKVATERLESLRTTLATETSLLERGKGELEERTSEAKELEEFVAAKKAEVDSLPEPERDLMTVRNERNEAASRVSRLAELPARAQAARNRLPERVDASKLPEMKDRLEGLDKVIAATDRAAMTERRDKSREYLKSVEAAEAEVRTATGGVDSATASRLAASDKLNRHLQGRPPGVAEDNLQEQLEELQKEQDERQRRTGERDQAEKTLRSLERSKKDVEKMVNSQGRINELVGELERLKAAFSRAGIQRHYLTELFSVLAQLTRSNLEAWETPFQVVPDPGQPFNFLFFKTAEPERLMDQSQMSGGQRIRLAISFLLAVQQLIFPELHFLVLDEPSTHLDEEGVESLGKLFRDMSQHLEAQDAQVIVVDHHQGLHRSIAKAIRLTGY